MDGSLTSDLSPDQYATFLHLLGMLFACPKCPGSFVPDFLDHLEKGGSFSALRCDKCLAKRVHVWLPPDLAAKLAEYHGFDVPTFELVAADPALP